MCYYDEEKNAALLDTRKKCALAYESNWSAMQISNNVCESVFTKTFSNV